MDFGYTPEQETLRQDVIDWIAENMTADIYTEMKGGEGGREGRHPEARQAGAVARTRSAVGGGKPP